MATPCVYTYKGVDYTYDKFVELLHGGELAKMVDEGVVTKLTDVSPLKPRSHGQEEGQRKGVLVHTTGDGSAVYNDGGTLLVYDASGKEIPKVDKVVPLMKDGVQLKTKDGTLRVRNVYNKKYLEAKRDYLKNIKFDNGELLPEPKEGEYLGMDEADRFVLDNTTNPAHAMDVYERAAEQNEAEKLGSKEYHIAQNLGFVTRDSFDKVSDKKNYLDRGDGVIERSYFRKPGGKEKTETLDQVAQQASAGFEGEGGDFNSITPEDVAQFIIDHPGGVRDFWNKRSEMMDASAEKFRELTGVEIDDDVIGSYRAQRAEKQKVDANMRKAQRKMEKDNAVLESFDEPITLDNIESRKPYLTVEQYESIKRDLEDRAAEQQDQGARGGGDAAERPEGREQAQQFKGSNQRALEAEIDKVDRSIEQKKREKQSKLNSLNNRNELPLDVQKADEFDFGGKQDWGDEAISAEMKKYDDEISALERKKAELEAGMEDAIESDREQGDMFDEDWDGPLPDDQVFFGKSKKKKSQDIPVSPIPQTGTPKKLSTIIKDLYDGLGRKLDYSKTVRKGAGGVYSPSSGSVRSKRANDLITASHEAGHAIRDSYGILNDASDGSLDAELSAFWDSGYASKPKKGMTPDEQLSYKREEGFAEWFRIFTSNPEEAKKFTGIYGKYEKLVPDKVKKVADTFSNDVRMFAGRSGVEMINANVEDLSHRNGVFKQLFDIIRNEGSARDDFRKSIGGIKDKVINGMDNNRYMAEKAWRRIHQIKGIEPMLGDANFLNHFKLLRDLPTKSSEFCEAGLRTARNEKVFDSKTGNRVSIPWVMEPFMGNTYKKIKAFSDFVHSVGIAKRTMEYQRKEIKSLVESDIKAGGKLPPQSILNRFPDLVSKYQKEISANTNGSYKEGRYDLRESILTGIGGNMFRDVDVAEKTIQEFDALKTSDPDKYFAVEESLRRYEVYADNLLKYLVDTGRMERDGYKFIKENNLFYFALNRIKELSPEEPMDVNVGKSGNISDRRNVIRKSTGGAGIIQNPYVSLMELTEKVVSEGDKNRVMLRFVDGLQSNRRMGEGEVEWLAEIGYQVDSIKKGEPIVTVYRKGKPEYWRLDKDVYDAFQATNGIPKSLYWLTTPQRIMRMSVTNWPIFQVLNRMRDITTRWQISQGDLSYKDFKNRGEAIENIKSLGGGQHGYNPIDKVDYYKFQTKMIKELAADRKTLVFLHPNNAVKAIGKLYDALLGSTEIQTRAEEYNSVYRKMKEKGLSDYDAQLEAARAQRELLDFKEIGEWMKLLNAMFPFTNARLKGAEAYGKSIKRNPGKTMLRFAMFAMVPQLVNSMIIKISSDDTKKRYLHLPDWRRDMFYNIPIPGTDWFFTWPKPFESGLVASVTGRVFDYYALDDKEAFSNKYWFWLANNLSPLNPSMITLNGGSWVSDVLSNYDSFRDTQIVPQYEDDLDVRLRKGTSTASNLGQMLQKMSGDNIDARKIDFAIKNQFGYYGDFALRSSNIGDDQSKTFKFDPSILRLFRKNSPSGSKDVEFVFNIAKKFGEPRGASVQLLVGLLQKYKTTQSKKERDKLEIYILDKAHQMRKEIEKHADNDYEEYINSLKKKRRIE